MSNLTPQAAAKLLTDSQLAQVILAPANLFQDSPEVAPVYEAMQYDKSVFSWFKAGEAIFFEAAQRFAVKQQEVTVEVWVDHGLDSEYLEEEFILPNRDAAIAFLAKSGYEFHDDDWFEHGENGDWACIKGGL